MSVEQWISLAALVLSGASVIISLLAARYAKRQADTGLGEVEPLFNAYQIPDDGKHYRNRFAVEFVNANRRPLYVHAVRLQLPSGVIAYADREGTRELLEAIHEVLISGQTIHASNVPIRLAGATGAEPPVRSTLVFAVQFEPKGRDLSFRVGVQIEYRLDGDRNISTAYASTGFEPFSP